MHRLAVILLFALVASCRTTRDARPTSSSLPHDGDLVRSLDPYDVIDPAMLEIRLERTPCFGACPVYSLTIRGDGSVRFSGMQHTAVLGEAFGTLDAAGLRSLVDAFRAADFMRLSIQCAGRVSDVPELHVTFANNRLSKTIANRWGGVDGAYAHLAPELRALYAGNVAVDELGKTIDAVSRVEQWVGFRP